MSNYISKAYACYNKDEEIRKRSTSGGIFYLLASFVLNSKNGYICGAVFSSDFRVVHQMSNNTNEVQKMMGSKYPQSSMRNCYAEVKKTLDLDTFVLFCGTPCQVYGLKSFLHKDYSNLITLDFVCHGVASPRIWDDYLTLFCKRSRLTDIRFKDKIKGWKKWHVRYQYGRKAEFNYGIVDIFMRSYLSSINHRPACFECPFKGIDRISDFTVADCWGIGEKNRRLNDNKGLSALLVHSTKGHEIFKEIGEKIIYEEYDPVALMEANWACITSSKKPDERSLFFELYSKADNKDKKKLLKKYYGLRIKKVPSYIKMKVLGQIM